MIITVAVEVKNVLRRAQDGAAFSKRAYGMMGFPSSNGF